MADRYRQLQISEYTPRVKELSQAAYQATTDRMAAHQQVSALVDIINRDGRSETPWDGQLVDAQRNLREALAKETLARKDFKSEASRVLANLLAERKQNA